MSPDTALMSPPGVGGDKKGKLPFFRKKHEKIHNNDQTLGDLKLYRAAFNAFVDGHDAGRRRELGVFLQTLEVTSQAPPMFPLNAPMGTGVVRCPYCRKRPALYELKGDGERVKCARCIDAAADSYAFMPQRFAALLRLLEAAERGAPPSGAPDILQSVRIAADKTQLTRVRAILGTQVSHTRRAATSGGPRNRNPLHPSGHAPGTSQGVARARPGTMGGQPQPRQMIGNGARRFDQATPSGGYPRGSSNPASPPAASYVPTVARCALCQRGIGLLFSPSARGAVCSACAHTRLDPQGIRAMPQCALEFARVYTAVVGALGVEDSAHNAKPLEQFLYHSNVATSQILLDQLCDSHRVRRIPLCTKCGLRIPYFSGETKGGCMRRPKGFRCCLICFNTCYEGHFPMFDADAAQFFATLLRRVARAVAESPPGVAGAQENLNFLAALHVVMTFDTFCDIRARFAPARSPPPPPPPGTSLPAEQHDVLPELLAARAANEAALLSVTASLEAASERVRALEASRTFAQGRARRVREKARALKERGAAVQAELAAAVASARDAAQDERALCGKEALADQKLDRVRADEGEARTAALAAEQGAAQLLDEISRQRAALDAARGPRQRSLREVRDAAAALRADVAEARQRTAEALDALGANASAGASAELPPDVRKNEIEALRLDAESLQCSLTETRAETARLGALSEQIEAAAARRARNVQVETDAITQRIARIERGRDEELSEFEQIRHQARERARVYEAARDDFSGFLEEFRQAVGAQLRELRGQLPVLTAAAREATRPCERAERTLLALGPALRRVDRSCGEAEAEVEAQVQAVHAATRRRRARSQNLADQLVSEREAAAELQDEAERLCAEAVVLREGVAAAERQHADGTERARADLEATVSELEERLRSEKEDVRALITEIAELRTRADRQRAELRAVDAEAQTRRAEASRERTQLEGELGALQAQLDALRQKRADTPRATAADAREVAEAAAAAAHRKQLLEARVSEKRRAMAASEAQNRERVAKLEAQMQRYLRQQEEARALLRRARAAGKK
eukprot:gnl/Chilomastix_cuspidata/987.p1 GENE.gnl/Chilomastix_cuspidata/987~~gnl/Chilomastix_cuspidata/987.p1  ORF type:complete len:1052 (+),score=340.97 gnl/Chilomastix_cuspidata/987:229-3384(+)